MKNYYTTIPLLLFILFSSFLGTAQQAVRHQNWMYGLKKDLADQEWIVPPEYRKITSYWSNPSLFLVKNRTGKYGLINTQGEWVLDTIYTELCRFYGADLFRTVDNQLVQVDSNGYIIETNQEQIRQQNLENILRSIDPANIDSTTSDSNWIYVQQNKNSPIVTALCQRLLAMSWQRFFPDTYAAHDYSGSNWMEVYQGSKYDLVGINDYSFTFKFIHTAEGYSGDMPVRTEYQEWQTCAVKNEQLKVLNLTDIIDTTLLRNYIQETDLVYHNRHRYEVDKLIKYGNRSFSLTENGIHLYQYQNSDYAQDLKSYLTIPWSDLKTHQPAQWIAPLYLKQAHWSAWKTAFSTSMNTMPHTNRY